jgi:hypothetical protein
MNSASPRCGASFMRPTPSCHSKNGTRTSPLADAKVSEIQDPCKSRAGYLDRLSPLPEGESGSDNRFLATLASHAAGSVRRQRPRKALQIRKMRPGRFALPRSKRTARPSTLRARCPFFPTAAETAISSVTMDDLNLLDSAFVVTVLSRTLPTAHTSLADYGLNWALHRTRARSGSDDPPNHHRRNPLGAWDGSSADAREMAVEFVGVGATDGRLVFV